MSAPPQNRLGLDQEYGIAPPRREPSEEDEEYPIGSAQLRAANLTTGHLELLAQQSVLPAQRRGRAEVIEDESDDGATLWPCPFSESVAEGAEFCLEASEKMPDHAAALLRTVPLVNRSGSQNSPAQDSQGRMTQVASTGRTK